MIEISMDTSQLERGLGQLLRNATSTRHMMAGIAAELHSLTEDNFQSESWGGEKWQKSARAIKEDEKIRHDTNLQNKGRSGKTLQDSGQLAASVTTTISNDFARIGTNKPYGAIHHFGGQIQARNKPYLLIPFGNRYARVKQVSIPARPYLPINPTGKLQKGAENRLLNVALDALAKGL